MSLLLAIDGTGENWSLKAWRRRFEARLAPAPVYVAGQDSYDRSAIHYAAVWRPQPGLLAALPNLKVIFNLGAGVDALIADKTLPDVPVVRIADDDLTGRMVEYVVLHVLFHHRRMPMLLEAQRRGDWSPKAQWAARSVRVGVMGLGVLGQAAARHLGGIGFNVAGWSRTARMVEGVECYHGPDGLAAFLARTDILVVLLPLTAATRGILSTALFKKLARDGVLDGPVVINAGRGGLQVEDDILKALDDGTLGGVTLDVFETEPLPQSSRLWSHPKAVLTPHNAADSDPEEISDYVVRQMRNHMAGGALGNVVDRTIGY